MNSEVEIIVNTLVDGEKCYIIFNFENPIKLDITSDNKEEIQKVFYDILNHFISGESISFKFVKTSDDLYNDVTEKYIQDLNNELIILKKNYLKPNAN